MSDTDRDIVDTAFREHRKAVFGVAYRMLGDANDAEDVVQETFVRLHANPPADLDSSLEPWLVRVAVNLARDHLRRSREDVRGEWLPSPVPTEHLATSEDPETRLSQLESVGYAFLHAAERLSPTQRAVFVLRQVFGYSTAETASALDLDVSSVKTNLHRARKRLDAETGPRRQVDLEAISEFVGSLAERDFARVHELLDEQVRTFADGGVHFFAAKPLAGRLEVMRLLEGLATKYGEIAIEVAQVNGEFAIVGQPSNAPNGWPPAFALVPETRDGRVVALRNVLDQGKLWGVAPPRHALLIGCTGMLADAAREITSRVSHATTVSRSPDPIPGTKTHHVAADWTEPADFIEKIEPAVVARGKFDLAVVWMHGSGEGVWPKLHEVLAPRTRVFEVLGSSDVSELAELADHAYLVPDALHRRVVLGKVDENGATRWLTHDEISRGTARLVLRDRSGVIGRV